MKAALISILLCSIAIVCIAEWRYDFAPINPDPVTTNGNFTSASIENISGEAVSVSIGMSGLTPTVDVLVVTSAGIGSSIGGAKTLFSESVTGNVYTNLAAVEYLMNDTITVYMTNASAGSATGRVMIINQR